MLEHPGRLYIVSSQRKHLQSRFLHITLLEPAYDAGMLLRPKWAGYSNALNAISSWIGKS